MDAGFEQVNRVAESTSDAVVDKYGEDGEIKPDSKNWDQFVVDMNKMLEEEVKLDAKVIKSENLSKVEISPSDLVALEWLIKE